MYHPLSLKRDITIVPPFQTLLTDSYKAVSDTLRVIHL